MKRLLNFKHAICLAIIILFAACRQRDSIFINDPNINNNSITNINATVKGRIVNEKKEPLNNVKIVCGQSTMYTNINGEFEFKNIGLNKDAAFVAATKIGYFNGGRLFKARQSKTHFVDIMLIEKSNIGSIKASNGGTLSLQNGATISLPANAIVTESNNASYSGEVNVAMSLIDPTEKTVFCKMPGDLRGISTDNKEKALQTYGMLAVELTGNNGEKLQIAAGKSATISFPIPDKMLGKAPSSLPLWSFNETTGFWKQETVAAKNGNQYVGQATHFSWWNADFPYENAATFNATFTDQNGNPYQWKQIYITDASGNFTGAYGYTDETGFAQGRVPENINLEANLAHYYARCGVNIIGNVAMGPFNANTDNSLGTKQITSILNPVYSASISGKLVNCNNNPIGNGYAVFVDESWNYYYAYSDANGDFNVNIELCSTGGSVSFYCADADGNNVTAKKIIAINSGSNSVSSIKLCGTHQIKANVVNCNNQPIISGYLSTNQLPLIPIKNGVIDFSFTPSAGQSLFVNYYAVDYVTGENSPPQSINLQAGINNLGTLVACITHSVSGTVVDCNNQPVKSGHVYCIVDGVTKYATIVNGTYSASFTPSNNNAVITYQAYSQSNYVSSSQTQANIVLGSNVLPQIKLCGSHTIKGKLVDCNNTVLPYETFVMKFTNNQWQYYYATADANGDFSLEVEGGTNSSITYYGQTQNLQGIPKNGTANPGVTNLGNVQVCGTHTVIGTATNCNGATVTDGIIRAEVNGVRYSAKITNGSFWLNFTPPVNNATFKYYIDDNTTNKSCAVKSIVITPGTNNIGNTQACGLDNNIFFEYSIDGVLNTIPRDSLRGDFSLPKHYINFRDALSQSLAYGDLQFSASSIGTGSSLYFYLNDYSRNLYIYSGQFINNPTLNITEVPSGMNTYSAGNFTATFNDTLNANPSRTLNVKFRVRQD